jgi:hypothetical protein
MNIFSTMAGKAVALVVLVVIAAGGAFYFTEFKESTAPVACTAEAMQCPDGSYVGRSGPNCQFVCPTANATTTTGGTTGGGILPYHSGIRGTVMAGPTCPVERNPPDPACADKPLATTVAVFRKGNAVTPFATTKSNASGAFEFSIPPGDYVVGAGESALPRCTQTPATVGPNTYTNITIECDTGIR